jgi:hypothetical protein
MVASSALGLSVAGSDPICPFCGQPLLKEEAVEHLASQVAAYEVDLLTKADAEAQLRADARVEAAENAMKARALAERTLATNEHTKEVAELNRRLEDEKKNQKAKVQAEVEKQLVAGAKQESERLAHDYAKREKQLEATVKSLKDHNDELGRRVEKLSAPNRGDFNEEDIFAQLARAFPEDEITRTHHGQRGADIFQTVRFRTDGSLTEAGLIIYECKDTLKWSSAFISQMKAQAKLHGTPYTILVTQVFPAGSANLAVLDEVVVVDPARCISIAEIMRRMVIESYRSGAIAGSQAEKTDELFRFIASVEFKERFDSLSDDVDKLEGLLAKERQSHQKVWTERGRIYASVSDTVTTIDETFKCILESKTRKPTVRVLRAEAVPA